MNEQTHTEHRHTVQCVTERVPSSSARTCELVSIEKNLGSSSRHARGAWLSLQTCDQHVRDRNEQEVPALESVEMKQRPISEC